MLQRPPSDRRPLAAHIWAKDELGFYVEPEWCSARLFEIEKFSRVIWDPACGVGRIIEAARNAGYRTFATDIVTAALHTSTNVRASFSTHAHLNPTTSSAIRRSISAMRSSSTRCG
jgi:hypothetical protein